MSANEETLRLEIWGNPAKHAGFKLKDMAFCEYTRGPYTSEGIEIEKETFLAPSLFLKGKVIFREKCM